MSEEEFFDPLQHDWCLCFERLVDAQEALAEQTELYLSHLESIGHTRHRNGGIVPNNAETGEPDYNAPIIQIWAEIYESNGLYYFYKFNQ